MVGLLLRVQRRIQSAVHNNSGSRPIGQVLIPQQVTGRFVRVKRATWNMKHATRLRAFAGRPVCSRSIRLFPSRSRKEALIVRMPRRVKARPDLKDRTSHSTPSISFHHPLAFWMGATGVALGVVAHLPGFLSSLRRHQAMGQMSMSPLMLGGMLLILFGLAATAYGLIPRSALRKSLAVADDAHFSAMDDARLTGRHWGLLFVLGVALVVDVMKPATLGFVVPGMKAEYGLTTQQVAYYPLTALAGTTIGSLVWGVLADRVGRRITILLASVLFMATSICGFMPSFGWNLFMCLIMGMSAGGMLPVVYALMAESMPAKKRGWLVVLHGGLGTVGGYIAAAGLATFFEPLFTWRILWFAGLPTGLMILMLNHWIPESPRFLLAHGRVDEAERVMARYGIVLSRRGSAPAANSRANPTDGSRLSGLLATPYLRHTTTVVTYGLGWGLVNWGFLTFVPTILRDGGVSGEVASRSLFLSAIIAIPGTVLSAYLYGLWSSRKSMVLFAMLTSFALLGFAVIDPGASGGHVTWLMPLMIILLVGSGGVISMLSPYTAEIYPTHLRAAGSGVAAASSKIGGIFAPVLAALVISGGNGFSRLALVVAAPLIISAMILWFTGVETRDRGLEEIMRVDS